MCGLSIKIVSSASGCLHRNKHSMPGFYVTIRGPHRPIFSGLARPVFVSSIVGPGRPGPVAIRSAGPARPVMPADRPVFSVSKTRPGPGRGPPGPCRPLQLLRTLRSVARQLLLKFLVGDERINFGGRSNFVCSRSHRNMQYRACIWLLSSFSPGASISTNCGASCASKKTGGMKKEILGEWKKFLL
jgi:hypothetical protein